jgi:hypothetical protein
MWNVGLLKTESRHDSLNIWVTRVIKKCFAAFWGVLRWNASCPVSLCLDITSKFVELAKMRFEAKNFVTWFILHTQKNLCQAKKLSIGIDCDVNNVIVFLIFISRHETEGCATTSWN